VQPKIDLLKHEQMSMLKQLLENEDWSRLPLPDKFEIAELQDPLKHMPKNLQNLLGTFKIDEQY
jgi:hypothetical protein